MNRCDACGKFAAWADLIPWSLTSMDGFGFLTEEGGLEHRGDCNSKDDE